MFFGILLNIRTKKKVFSVFYFKIKVIRIFLLLNRHLFLLKMTEFTVILYAGGTNRLSNDLSNVKSLLPIGNRPLIWYTLEIIKHHPSLNSSPLLILTSNQYRQNLDDYLSTLDLSYELIIHRQHHESTTSANDDQQQQTDELGTIDILRACYSKIRTESICLISCDLFGKMNLTPLINMFRVRDASLAILLLKTPFPMGKESIAQPGQKTKFTPGRQISSTISNRIDFIVE